MREPKVGESNERIESHSELKRMTDWDVGASTKNQIAQPSSGDPSRRLRRLVCARTWEFHQSSIPHQSGLNAERLRRLSSFSVPAFAGRELSVTAYSDDHSLPRVWTRRPRGNREDGERLSGHLIQEYYFRQARSYQYEIRYLSWFRELIYMRK